MTSLWQALFTLGHELLTLPSNGCCIASWHCRGLMLDLLVLYLLVLYLVLYLLVLFAHSIKSPQMQTAQFVRDVLVAVKALTAIGGFLTLGSFTWPPTLCQGLVKGAIPLGPRLKTPDPYGRHVSVCSETSSYCTMISYRMTSF